MRLIINILLFALVAFLLYLLVLNIRGPIAFNAEKSKRENAVQKRLTDIRVSQEIFRDITGKFAGDFDTLNHVLRNDSITFENIVEDPDDPSNQDLWKIVYSYYSAIDSIRDMDISLDSLRYIPYTNGKTFNIEADTLTYQSTLVHVVEVGTKYKEFMGKYASPSFSKYDASYNPNKTLKFGDLNAPNLSGNW